MGRSSIFVSYRRDDTGTLPEAFRSHLVEHIAAGRVFLDSASIAVGDPFPERIRHALAEAKVCVAFIGESWGANGRILREDDWVHQELRIALDRNLKILPVYVRRGPITPAELPPDLQALANTQALYLRPETLEADMRGVLGKSMELLGERWPPVEPGGTLYTALSIGYTLVAGAWLMLLLLLGGLFGDPSRSAVLSALLMLAAILIVLRAPILHMTRELSRHRALRLTAILHLVASSIMFFGEASSDVVQWFVFALMPAGGLYLGANSMQRRVRV